MTEPLYTQPSTESNLKKVSVIANVIVGVLATSAILLALFDMYTRNEDRQQSMCRARINAYAEGLRDERDNNGWDALVSSAERDPNRDVKEIARQMRIKIDNLKSASNLRSDAFNVCNANSDFEPPR
jgi:hypothetical protein